MANLVPLHIDKDTGELVATRNPTVGGGGSLPPVSTGAEGYLHIQNVAADTWLIPHNAGTDLLVCQVYTSTGDFLIPDEITIVDINNVEVTFGTPITGRAHVVFFVVP